jgi:hypothetical protein
LVGHECVLYNDPSTGRLFRWDFDRGGVNTTIDPAGLISSHVHNPFGFCIAFEECAQ